MSYLSAALQCKCPRCRKGNMFKEANPYKLGKFMKMNEVCTTCKQPMEIEPGFYYGTAYVSYALTVAFSVSTFVAWWVIIGFSINDGDYRVLYWGIFNAVLMIVLQPVFMRFSRSLWLSWFVPYDADWKKNPISAETLAKIKHGDAEK